jgi:predicted MFS family arabinose efflux permease
VFIQQITRILHEGRLAPIGLAGLGASFLLLGLSRGYGMLWAIGLLYGLSHGIVYPTLFVRFLDFQRPDEIGRGATLFQGSFSIGWGLLPMVGGTLIRLLGFPIFFTLLSLLSFGSIGLHRLAERSASRREVRR